MWYNIYVRLRVQLNEYSFLKSILSYIVYCLGRNTGFDSRRIEICVGEVWLLIRVNRRRKFAGSMWKKPEVLDRKSGTDKWCESASNATPS